MGWVPRVVVHRAVQSGGTGRTLRLEAGRPVRRQVRDSPGESWRGAARAATALVGAEFRHRQGW